MSDIPPTASHSESTLQAAGQSGLKDTFESILIALILAFVFRAFVVEAFVIPTGSMATTLLGAHMRLKCEDCGYDFKANFSAPQIPGSDDVSIPRDASVNTPQGQIPLTFNLTCPNCGFRVQRVNRERPDNDATSPPVHYGDRILVLKYAYLFASPERWDVVVFKSPYDQRASVPRPVSKPDFQQNYIKRLVGLPGEQLMILDGDIYTRPISVSASASQSATESGQWTVQQKPRHAQDAVWRIVADNDYQPRNLERGALRPYRSPWVSEGTGGFTTENAGRVFASAGTGTSVLRFDPTANDRKFALTDWLGFDMTDYQQRAMTRDTYDFAEPSPLHNVSDLKLELTWQPLAVSETSGPLRLTLTKYGHKFVAEVFSGKARLVHVKPDGTDETLATATLESGGAPLKLAFSNVDYRVALTVNGREVFATTPAQYSPDVAALIAEYGMTSFGAPQGARPTVEIAAVSSACRISHVALWRDIYYINSRTMVASKPTWATPDNPITLGAKEYFVLGDNSALSLDARFWSQDIDLAKYEDLEVESGRVPERFMLGKAFFVYWPAGYRPTASLPGVIPNFGEMRLIR